MVTASRTTVIAGLLAFAAPAAAQVPAWRVAARPVTVVGLAGGETNELNGVMAAHRLRDGRLLVADSDPPQIRVYDPSGAFVTRIGRQGSGPGEFRGRLSLYVAPGDSVVVYDDETRRWTLYTPDAKLVRSWLATAAELARLEPAEFHRSLIHTTVQPVAACYRQLLTRFPAPRDTAYREVFPDSTDRAWVREEQAPVWTVYSIAGTPLGRVTLPAGFAVLQIGDGFVVGTRRDDDGVQRVEVITVSMPKHTATPPCAREAGSFPRDTSPVVHAMRIDLQNLESAGTAFRGDYGHYPATFDSLFHASNFMLSRDNTVHWLNHGGEGWDAVIRNPQTTQWCRILIGDPSPTWLYRHAFCGP